MCVQPHRVTGGIAQACTSIREFLSSSIITHTAQALRKQTTASLKRLECKKGRESKRRRREKEEMGARVIVEEFKYERM